MARPQAGFFYALTVVSDALKFNIFLHPFIMSYSKGILALHKLSFTDNLR